MPTALESQVRHVDEDRWLASRFAPADVRGRLVALYALNDEVARSSEVVTQPALADIRLAWWRDAIAEIYAGKSVRAHPVLAEFASGFRDARWEQSALEALIEARRRDLETFTSMAELQAYFAATAGQILRLALAACGVEANAKPFIAPAAQAWGVVGWLRAGKAIPGDTNAGAMLEGARSAHEAARRVALPSSAFPAVGYVALVPAYIRALSAGRRDVALLGRQLRLVGAAATGRL